ncbi:hypothetical protein [Daejeonella sp.]|uniref:hypothetical protein n=1 Tax=Daejeonella sp. TaxID=2805397 RepID=UPI0039835D50
MVKYFFSSLILLFTSLSLIAQTTKTGVLVIGNTAASVAASLQSARSGAKTILLTQTPAINVDLSREDIPYLQKIQNHYKVKLKKKPGAKDSTVALDLNMRKDQYLKLIKSVIDTTKNLSLTLNTALEKIEKDGKGWEVKLKNGQKIKADVVVDATENLFITSILRVDVTKTMGNSVALNSPFDSKLYRSTVASANYGANASSAIPISIGAFLPAGVENFIIVPKSTSTMKLVSMSAGQAAGTIASYCAFFKTTTKNINVRAVQTELLTFDAQLIPLADVPENAPNFLTFQRMALSGLLKPVISKEGDRSVMKFDTIGTISSEQLRIPVREFYSRSQIWFADNKKEVMTIEDAISLFMFTATRGDELKKEIEEGWKESFQFESKFDLKRPITRKEFAILADRYLQPFNIKVDFAGNLLR